MPTPRSSHPAKSESQAQPLMGAVPEPQFSLGLPPGDMGGPEVQPRGRWRHFRSTQGDSCLDSPSGLGMPFRARPLGPSCPAERSSRTPQQRTRSGLRCPAWQPRVPCVFGGLNMTSVTKELGAVGISFISSPPAAPAWELWSWSHLCPPLAPREGQSSFFSCFLLF